jgi:hypothetical protein
MTEIPTNKTIEQISGGELQMDRHDPDAVENNVHATDRSVHVEPIYHMNDMGIDKELRTLTIDPEFRDLIPPLTEEERRMLEGSIMKHGCDTPLAVWNGVIVDGHNRYAICHEHGIPFAVSEKEFESREDALAWIITNQLGRRNLTSYQRGELVLKFEPLLKLQAKERQLRKPIDSESVHQNSDEQNDAGRWTLNMLGKLAGVSHDTIHKVKKLSEAAGEETKTKLRRGDVSINRAYTGVMHKEHADQTKVCDRCEQEKPVTHFAIPSNRHGFSALCRACEKEVAEASRQAADAARKTQESVEVQSISSIGMHKGHPIHVAAPLPDRPDMFPHVENHMRFIVENFLAGAQNAMKLYTIGMASPENTEILRGTLESVLGAVEAFDEHIKEIQNNG